jgi:beta-lactamase regulating signal transducer with metallopeptidase domain
MAERAFVREFVKDMNPALACVRMGHDELIAMDVAYEYLGKEYIRDAMAEALLAHKEQQRWNDFSARDLGITDAYIMMRLKSIADRAEKPGEQLKALELLGKTIGVFKDTTKVEVTQPKASAFSPEERKRMIETYRSRAK